MQNVSQYYLDAISNPPCEWAFKMYIKRKKEYSVTCTLTEEHIVSDSISINRVALKDQYFGIAGVGSTKLTFKLTDAGVNLLQTNNRLSKTTFIDFDVWIKTADANQNPNDITENLDHTVNTTGRVHIGEFHITEVNSTVFECEITAYDAMIAFDRYIRAADRSMLKSQEHSYGYILTKFCERCSKGVYNVVLDDQIDFSSMPNGTLLLGIDADTKFENYREAILYMAQLLGCFAYITRDGKLSFKSFSQSADYTLLPGDVFNHEMGGVYYEVYNMLYDTNGGHDYDIRDDGNPPAQVTPDNPATVVLNENPFLRKFEAEDATDVSAESKTAIDNIFVSVQGTKFNGGSFTGTYHPEFDLGDMLDVTIRTMYNHQTIRDVNYPYVLISEINEKYIVSSSVKSNDYCGDVDINQKSSQAKGVTGGGGSATPLGSVITIIGNENKNVLQSEVKLFKNTLVEVYGEMPMIVWFTGTLTAVSDGFIYFKLIADGDVYDYTPKFRISEGINTVSFSVGIEALDVATVRVLQFYACCENTTCSFASRNYQMNIYSAGARSSEPSWTGLYDVSEIVPEITIDDDDFVNLEDTTASAQCVLNP